MVGRLGSMRSSSSSSDVCFGTVRNESYLTEVFLCCAHTSATLRKNNTEPRMYASSLRNNFIAFPEITLLIIYEVCAGLRSVTCRTLARDEDGKREGEDGRGETT